MATKKPMPFERSKKDSEPKGMKEGSLKEERMDRKQMMGQKAMPKKSSKKC